MLLLDRILGKKPLPSNCTVCRKKFESCRGFFASPINDYTFRTTDEVQKNLPFPGAEIITIESVNGDLNDGPRYTARYRCKDLKNGTCQLQLSPKLPLICRIKPIICDSCPINTKKS